MDASLLNFPLHYVEISEADQSECPSGGDHEPLTETDFIPEYLNGHLSQRKILMTTCNKCGSELPAADEEEAHDDLND